MVVLGSIGCIGCIGSIGSIGSTGCIGSIGSIRYYRFAIEKCNIMQLITHGSDQILNKYFLYIIIIDPTEDLGTPFSDDEVSKVQSTMHIIWDPSIKQDCSEWFG